MIKLTQEKQDDMVSELSDYHKDGETGNDSTFQRMSKCERYAVGQQWDREVLEANKGRRKFSLTINRIFPIVNQLSGFDAKNPKDVKIKNLRGGTQKGAELLSALAKHTVDLNHAVRQQNQCFEDGVRSGRGFIEADVDFSDDPIHGDITIRKLDPFTVIPDRSCKSYDYNDLKNGAKYIIVEEWIDKEYIKKKYPNTAKDLGDDASSSRRYGGMFSGLMSWVFGGKSGTSKTTYRSEEIDLSKSEVDLAEYKFKVCKYYWKTFEKGAILIKRDDVLNSMTLTKQADINYAKQMIAQNPQMGELIEKDKHGNPVSVAVLHRALMVGEVLLDYQKDPFEGMNLFPVVRFSPYFVNGYEFSVVDNLIGSQDRVNWSASMELNLIRKLANTGWKITRDVTGKFKTWLADHGSEDGIVLDESEGGGKIEKLEQTVPSQGYEHIGITASNDVSSISQVRLEEPQSKNESGRSVLAKQNWAVQNASNITSNWDFTQELLGEIVLGIIRYAGVYSNEEIMAIVDEEELVDPELMQQARQHVIQTLKKQGIPEMTPPEKPDVMALDGEDRNIQKATLLNFKAQMVNFNGYMAEVDKLALPIAKAMIIDEISSMKYGKYGVKVELAPHAETNRMRRMIETFELNSALVQSGQFGVSRKLLIEATDIQNKDEIVADVPQMPMPQKVGAA